MSLGISRLPSVPGRRQFRARTDVVGADVVGGNWRKFAEIQKRSQISKISSNFDENRQESSGVPEHRQESSSVFRKLSGVCRNSSGIRRNSSGFNKIWLILRKFVDPLRPHLLRPHPAGPDERRRVLGPRPRRWESERDGVRGAANRAAPPYGERKAAGGRCWARPGVSEIMRSASMHKKQ